VHRRWLFLPAAAALVAACLTVAFLPDHDGGSGPTTPAAGAHATRPSATASPTASRHGTDATPTPSAAATRRNSPSAPAKPPASVSTAAIPAPLAGRIRPGVTYRGIATFYDADGSGSCLYDPGGDTMTAAMNHTDYETAKACGAYVRVRAAGGASVTVRITNECPGECAPGQLDLSAEAFARLAAPSRGRVPITWNLVSPGTAGPISVRYKTGSTRYWCAIQIIGHRNPLARLEVGASGRLRRLPRTDYNYFLSDDGTGCGGPIRITDIFGERLTLTGIALRPDAVQPTRVQFARH
jgi:expansin (peptidoglycan-binding protein)